MINLNEQWQERRHWPADMEKHKAVMFSVGPKLYFFVSVTKKNFQVQNYHLRYVCLSVGLRIKITERLN